MNARRTEPLVTRVAATRILTRAGIDADDVAELLASVTFPAPMDEVVARGQRMGITRGTLIERMGGSP